MHKIYTLFSLRVLFEVRGHICPLCLSHQCIHLLANAKPRKLLCCSSAHHLDQPLAQKLCST